MPKQEPSTPDQGSDQGTAEDVSSPRSVEISGSQNLTISGVSAVDGDLTVTSGGSIVQGDWVEGDKFTGDKVYGDKITHIQEAPKAKPTLPAHTPHNLPERTTSAERFVGRSQELAQLGSLLDPDASRVYLTGMGGVGKSELAIQYAYDSLDTYRGGILRLDARQGLEAMAQQVVTFLRGVFPEVALPEDRSPTELLAVCWSQWPASASPPEPVLLILDDQRGDKEGYGAERQLLEGVPGRFRRLITQREAAPAGAQAMGLPLLQRDASLEMLALQAGEDGPARLQAEEQAARALCAEVGDLPLALVLLGARLAKRPDLRLEQLLGDLKAKGAEARVLGDSHPELGARLGVVASLLISWEPLSTEAKELAVLLGVMAPALIPWDLVEACRREDQELEEGSAFGEAQAELLKAQLLDRVAAGRYQLHPLVRGFVEVQARGMESVRQSWRSQLARAVAATFVPKVEQGMILAPKQQADVSLYLPHLTKAAQYEAGVKGVITDQVAAYAAAAEPLIRRDLAISEVRYGPENINVARDLNHLALLLEAANRPEEAKPLMRRALAIQEAWYGQEHPEVARALMMLAYLLIKTNRLQEAGYLVRRALEIYEANCGAEHKEVILCLFSLVGIFYATNRPEEAESLKPRLVSILKTLSNDHPLLAAFGGIRNLFQTMGFPEDENNVEVQEL